MSTGNLPREVPIPTGARRSWMPYDSHPDLIWEYTHLNEPHLTTKLEELSKWGSLTDTDYATLQPSLNPDEASQDRHVIEDWDIAGGKWKFRAVFDGEHIFTCRTVELRAQRPDHRPWWARYSRLYRSQPPPPTLREPKGSRHRELTIQRIRHFPASRPNHCRF